MFTFDDMTSKVKIKFFLKFINEKIDLENNFVTIEILESYFAIIM